MEEEKVNEDVKPSEEESTGLSAREALEKAIQDTKASEPEEPRDTTVSEVQTPSREESPLEPPPEFTAEEKEDFRNSTRKQQEASLRLHRSRLNAVGEIRSERARLAAERQENESIKKLADSMAPYLRARGIKEAPEVALTKALEMWRDLDGAKDPEAAKAKAAEYLAAKGVEPPKDWLQANVNSSSSPQIEALQKTVQSLSSEIAKERQMRAQVAYGRIWDSFVGEKNAAGSPRFPDLTETEQGVKLASNIASLVSGVSDLSKQFIATAKSRIPNLTVNDLLAEAYRFYGGKVDDSSPTRTQSQVNHVAKASRAASSVPGRGGNGTGGQTPKKFKTYKEAVAQAISDLKEAEGR